MSFDLLDVNFKRGRCIVAPAILRSHEDNNFGRSFDFILDTGASSAHISKTVLYQMGYNDAMFTKDKKESFAVIGKYFATLCKVQRLDFCGINFRNHNVKVWNPPAGHHIDGIIGMNILRYFNIYINSDAQRVVIERSQTIIEKSRKFT